MDREWQADWRDRQAWAVWPPFLCHSDFLQSEWSQWKAYTHRHRAALHHRPHQSEAIVCPGGDRRLNETSPVNWVNQWVSTPRLIWDTICMDGHFNKTHWADGHMSPSVTMCVCVRERHLLTQWVCKQVKTTFSIHVAQMSSQHTSSVLSFLASHWAFSPFTRQLFFIFLN